MLADGDSEDTTLSMYDIVSYTIGTDDVYELTLVANARKTEKNTSDPVKLVTNGRYTFVNNIKDVNLTKIDAQTTNAADAETIYLVMTQGVGGKKDTFAAYKGFANVPTITQAKDADTVMSVFSKDDNDPATVVFVLDTADVNVSSNNKDIIYIKGSDTDKSYTNALGHFYEYDCFVNGDTTATTIKTESQFTKDTLIYGPSYNSKGILIGQDAFVNADHTTGTDMAYGTTTDSVKNDVIKLGGASYAYAKNVEVYFIDVDGKLVAGTIDEIAYDEDDMAFVKTDKDGLLTHVYIKVKDSTATVTPSSVGYKVADKLDGTALSIAYASNKITVKNGQVVDNDGANKAFGAKATLTAKVEKFEGGWAEFATFTATVTPGTPSNVFADGTTGADITTGALPNGNYRVTVTLSNSTIGTLAVGNATMFSIP